MVARDCYAPRHGGVGHHRLRPLREARGYDGNAEVQRLDGDASGGPLRASRGRAEGLGAPREAWTPRRAVRLTPLSRRAFKRDEALSGPLRGRPPAGTLNVSSSLSVAPAARNAAPAGASSPVVSLREYAGGHDGSAVDGSDGAELRGANPSAACASARPDGRLRSAAAGPGAASGAAPQLSGSAVWGARAEKVENLWAYV